MFEDRFQKVYSQVEIELAQSIPVINHNCEILFFYGTSPNDEYSYVVDEIEYVFSRDIVTNKIRKVALSEIEENLIKACCGEIIRPLIMDDEAFETEESYYKNYEAVYEQISKGVDIDSQVANDLMSDFEKLIPNGHLKNLYKHLGEQLFRLM